MIEQYLNQGTRLEDAVLYRTGSGDLLLVVDDDQNQQTTRTATLTRNTNLPSDGTVYKLDLFNQTADEVDVEEYETENLSRVPEPQNTGHMD
jgi:hypothetical protein